MQPAKSVASAAWRRTMSTTATCSTRTTVQLQQHAATKRAAGTATSSATLRTSSRPDGTNPAMSFPCVDQNELRAQRLLQQRRQPDRAGAVVDLPNLGPANATQPNSDNDGPEPAYANVVSGYELYSHEQPFALDYGGVLPRFDLAYETWGKLNSDRSNVVLLHTGLSASSHAHSTPANPAEGWWEKFIGPGLAIDTDKFFVMCTNVLGGCYGSTGPSSLDPSDGQPYATRFPILSIFDMVRAQFHLLSSLGIDKVYASVGSSMGGMQSLAAAYVAPERVGKVVSISATSRSSPSSIAMRHAQRSVLMADPNWNRGFYYDDMPPHTGMKLARQIATITYRSGPEWEQRFSRRRRDLTSPSFTAQESEGSHLPSPPVLCPDFLIETYLDHQGEQFCLKYDANSLIYISKAMDLFDMSQPALDDLSARRAARDDGRLGSTDALCPVPPPQGASQESRKAPTGSKKDKPFISSLPSSHAYLPALASGLRHHKHPTLVMGCQSDTLFPIEQQRELAEVLKSNGTDTVYYELAEPWGHDTFLLDVRGVGSAVKGFLETPAASGSNRV
ncbi:Serine O-succinyltransferase [Microbotryomycetes sp. JL221]|nr:Serine O-succinyltransferase [Microbotryomycetes sp. JL221]